MIIHEVLCEKDIFCGLCKKDKFRYSNIVIYVTIFLSFYTCHKKCLFTAKLCEWAYIVQMYTVNFLSNFFNIIKFI
jgi:hypothetical protein